MSSNLVEFLGIDPVHGLATFDRWIQRGAPGAVVTHFSGVAATVDGQTPAGLAALQKLSGAQYTATHTIKVEKRLFQCTTAEIFELAEKEVAKAEAREVGQGINNSVNPSASGGARQDTTGEWRGRGRGRQPRNHDRTPTQRSTTQAVAALQQQTTAADSAHFNSYSNAVGAGARNPHGQHSTPHAGGGEPYHAPTCYS